MVDPGISTAVLPRPAVRVRGLVKAFGGRTVLGPLDLDIHPGEFVALLGHNGAGKSTLIKILDGVYTADGGELTSSGEGCVGVVHQELGLIDGLSVLENLRLGQAPERHRFGPLNRTAERRKAQETLDRFGLDYDLDARVADLAPSDRALLAVARAAAARPRVIVLDETTSVLSTADAADLIRALKEKSPSDIAFVMVTHKLQEALDLATRVVVLRDGVKVCDREVPLPSVEEVTEFLTPEKVATAAVEHIGADFATEILFEMSEVRHESLGPIDLRIRRGECVAVTGQGGSALTTFAYVAAGKLKPITGTVTVNARRAIVPPNREREGALPKLTVRENVALGNLGRWLRGPLLSLRAERASVSEMISSLGVLPANDQAEQSTLSGGNQQKVIFGRAILSDAEVLILCEPSRGVDVATRRQIYDLMRSLKASGCALLVVATDPQDILATSDRILLMRDGRIESEYDAADITSTELAGLV
ncbi:ATP-binding cassette domain-containing protein [Streptomyces sp. NPDC055722]